MSDKDVNGYEGLLWLLSSVAKKWKQPKCPSTGETINRQWYMHTMEHGSAMKWNNLPTHLTTRENLKVTTPSERSWNQRVTHCGAPLLRHSGKGRTIGTENSSWLSGAGVRSTAHGLRGMFGEMNGLRLDFFGLWLKNK